MVDSLSKSLCKRWRFSLSLIAKMMKEKKEWKRVRLGEVLTPVGRIATPEPSHEYSEVTVRLWGKGVIERGRVLGSQFNGRRFVAKSGDFIVSKIDARNGAMGLIPQSLDGALVTSDFPLFEANEDRFDSRYLEWLSKTADFVELCLRASEGTTNRVRLKPERFLALEIPLPPLSEQRRIVARIEALATEIAEVKRLRQEAVEEAEAMLKGAFWSIANDCVRKSMREIAPLVRRRIEVSPMEDYRELGVRSFGKGTFHKSPISGLELGSKKIFQIEPGDVVFSNVFAWEGAVAVAQENDAGRVGSHRFITRRPVPSLITAEFLCFYFRTDEGLVLINEASPGGAGRNRTLSLKALDEFLVPTPSLASQEWFGALVESVAEMRTQHDECLFELDALLPAILDRAFKGEL